MIRPIVKDIIVLQKKCSEASSADAQVVMDLVETLTAYKYNCVGMAANMIGVQKKIIAFYDKGVVKIMLNPKIVQKTGEYETSEGCLSLAGARKTIRYKQITVSYQDLSMHPHTDQFNDFTAEIIQHEVDHCEGILI